MKSSFLSTLDKIVKYLGGSVYFPKQPKTISGYDLGLFFFINGKVLVDNLVLVPINQESDFGIMMRSLLTNGRLVSLAEYTYLLVKEMDRLFDTTMQLCPISYRLYMTGKRFRVGFRFNMN
jgi:hypothetical protein